MAENTENTTSCPEPEQQAHLTIHTANTHFERPSLRNLLALEERARRRHSRPPPQISDTDSDPLLVYVDLDHFPELSLPGTPMAEPSDYDQEELLVRRNPEVPEHYDEEELLVDRRPGRAVWSRSSMEEARGPCEAFRCWHCGHAVTRVPRGGDRAIGASGFGPEVEIERSEALSTTSSARIQQWRMLVPES